MEGGKHRWGRAGFAAAAGAGVAAFAAVLFRLPAAAPLPPAETPAPRLALAETRNPVVRDETALFDPTPLFLPTKWNGTGKEAPRLEPGTLPPFPPRYAFSGDRLLPPFPPAAGPATPGQALEASPAASRFPGFGRTAGQPPALSPRPAFAEVFEAGSGRRVLEGGLGTEPLPVVSGWWKPPVFLAAVGASGLISPLVLVAGSGSEEIDSYFRRSLETGFRVGDRLRPGFYRIAVGP